jgi:PAS domain-containing protein
MTDELFKLISIALNLLLGGGLVAVWLRYRVQSRVESRTDFTAVLQAVTEQRDEAWAHNRALDIRIANMEAEINGLRLARDLDPFPNWVVDRTGEYQFVNREFERLFLEPQGKNYRDAIGKTHEQLGWPDAFCRTLKTLDAEARSRPDGRATTRSTVVLPELGQVTVTVHKFPIRFKDAIVAYAGFVTDIAPDDKLIGMPLA